MVSDSKNRTREKRNLSVREEGAVSHTDTSLFLGVPLNNTLLSGHTGMSCLGALCRVERECRKIVTMVTWSVGS